MVPRLRSSYRCSPRSANDPAEQRTQRRPLVADEPPSAPCHQTNSPGLSSTATLLPDGEVLAAGGESADGSMTTAREGQTATLLPDGQVLMAGGTLFDHPKAAIGLASAVLYTP